MRVKSFLVGLLLVIPSVFALEQGVGGWLLAFFAAISAIMYYIFGLGFLGLGAQTLTAAFIRFCLWIVFFVLFYEVIGRNRIIDPTRRAAIAIVSISLAFLATFNIAPGAVLAIGGVFGFVTAILLIAVPLFPVFWALFIIPATTRAQIALKIFLLLIAIWVLSLAHPLFTGEVRLLV